MRSTSLRTHSVASRPWRVADNSFVLWAIHYEKELHPDTPEALYKIVPVAHPSPTQVVKPHHKWH